MLSPTDGCGRTRLRDVCWRLVVSCCCLGAVFGCAGGRVSADDEACAVAPNPRAREWHLGDGTSDYHYYVIADFLRENPGSEAETLETERLQREAVMGIDLKPPSSSIAESEFSHLLRAIARSNGGIGARVFDAHGLMVGTAGVVLEGIVLPEERLATLRSAPEDPPLEVSYTCAYLRERAQSCDASAPQAVSCWTAAELANDCRGPVTVYYRPVLDHQRDSRFLGVGVLCVRSR